MNGRTRGPAWACLALALLVAGPLLTGRGFALVGDMVFVPRQPWKDQWLAADGSVPRSVPVDALVSGLTAVVPGDLLQKLVLVLLVAAAGWGMLRLLRDAPPGARLAGAVVYLWNPYVYERLAIGHWALLCGYACLPWVAAAALAVRRDGLDPARLAGLAIPLAVAAVTSPTGGLLAAGVAGALVLPSVRALAATSGVAVVANLPWLLPGLLHTPGVGEGADAGVAAFAARSDTPYGVVGSVLSLGGMWKTAVAPDATPAWLFALLSLGITVVALAGVAACRRAGAPRPAGRTGLVVVALVGLALALLPTTAEGRSVVEAVIEMVPGAGILRDSQKWVAPFALLVACGWAYVVEVAGSRLRAGGSGWVAPTTLLGTLVPVLAVPTLAWGLSGTLAPGSFPDEWRAVAEVMDNEGADAGRTAVLPWSTYRRFTWNHGHAVLDPAPRFFPGDVVTSDDLVIDGDTVVPGDNGLAAAIGTVLAREGDPTARLRDLGVGWVLVERRVPGSAQAPAVTGTVLHEGPELTLVRLGEVAAPTGSEHGTLIKGADLVSLVVVCSVCLPAVRWPHRQGRRRRYSDA